MSKYYNRIADEILKKKLKAKGAVLITGAKWCGKTTTASRLAKSILYMQDPQNKDQNIQMADINPSLLLNGDIPRLIDEWQLAPKLWDAVRFEVDKRNDFGQFILTGSAVPPNLPKNSHTGIGRISRLRMRPMSLYESQDSNGQVSLQTLFNDKKNEIIGENSIDIYSLAYFICRGGWPRAIGCEEDIALQQAVDYYDGVVESDISRVDNVKRDPERVKRLMRSYARFIGSQVKVPKILADIKANDADTISESTINSYMSALKDIFVIENAPSWNPNLRSKSAIQASDTRYFADPSIAAAALGIGPSDLVNDLQTMGFLFENMCIRDLRVYAEALDGTVYHYRDKNNLECDAVIHLKNGSYGLIEIKLGGDKLIEEGVITLTKLSNKIDFDKMKRPAFKMILVGVGKYAYKREDDILIVPIGCLKN